MIPESEIYLCSGVNLTRDYSYTMTFPDATRQADYFRDKIVLSFTDYTYQRDSKGIKVSCNAELLREVNYLMFRNTNYSEKWIYCFIDQVEYISANTSIIMFTVDVWQTFLFWITFKNCQITREHVTNDSYYNNRLDECLDVGTVETIDYENIDDLDELCVIIAVTKTPAGSAIDGYFMKGTFSGCAYYYFDNDTDINAFLAGYISNPSSVIAVFMFPTLLLGSFTYSSGDQITGFSSFGTTYTANKVTSGAINGYTPKNKKCYQYPYNFLEVSNQQGAINQYKYEDWLATTASFTIRGNVAPSPTVYIMPANHKQAIGSPLPNIDSNEMMTISNYPLCTWSYDAYQSWLAQNTVSNILSIGGSALSLASGIMTKSPMAIASGVMGVAETIGGFYEASLQANPLKGSSSGGGGIASDTQNFRVSHRAITAERLKIIDDYFSAYGYKVNRLGTPDIYSRENWNFLQCSDVNLLCSVPYNYADQIKSSLRKGITFWHDDDIGNYNRTNGVV